MPLFDTEADLFGYSKKTGGVQVPNQDELLRVSGRYMTMQQAIGELRPDKTIYFVTAGSWAMHDLLKYILMQTGPAEVKCFTWAVSIPGAQMIVKLIESGQITRCYFMAHSLMRKMCAAAMAILQNHCYKCVGACNHAKGFILKNDRWTVSVIASANYSNNPTIEGGAISTSPAVYDMNEKWLNPIFENSDNFIGDHMLTEYSPPARPEDKAQNEDSKILYLIRGLPGSGKSSLAAVVADAVFENDDFFDQGNGVYKFDINHLDSAKTSCYANTRDAMESGTRRIAVANTFVDDTALEPYYKLARIFGYKVFCLVAENRLGTQNIHRVPEHTIEKMRKRFKVKL